MKRGILVMAVAVMLTGCSSGESVETAAQRIVVEWDREYGKFAAGFNEADVEVFGWLVDGDCAAVDVREPREPGSSFSGEMTVYMRQDGDRWVGLEYVTGHSADDRLDGSLAGCLAE